MPLVGECVKELCSHVLKPHRSALWPQISYILLTCKIHSLSQDPHYSIQLFGVWFCTVLHSLGQAGDDSPRIILLEIVGILCKSYWGHSIRSKPQLQLSLRWVLLYLGSLRDHSENTEISGRLGFYWGASKSHPFRSTEDLWSSRRVLRSTAFKLPEVLTKDPMGPSWLGPQVWAPFLVWELYAIWRS